MSRRVLSVFIYLIYYFGIKIYGNSVLCVTNQQDRHQKKVHSIKLESNTDCVIVLRNTTWMFWIKCSRLQQHKAPLMRLSS